jgi:hypothetical protein
LQDSHFKFRHEEWVSHALSDAQNVLRIDGAKLLQTELLAVRRRNWNWFWADDESWML